MTKLKALLAKKDSNKGFTLMEMIIVIAIIAILIALIAPNLISYLDTANETKRAANAKVCYTSANAWVAQQKVTGKSVKATTSPIKIDNKTNEDNLQLPAGSTADKEALLKSLDNSKWADGDSVELTFNSDGVCSKAVYKSEDKTGEYPQK